MRLQQSFTEGLNKASDIFNKSKDKIFSGIGNSLSKRENSEQMDTDQLPNRITNQAITESVSNVTTIEPINNFSKNLVNITNNDLASKFHPIIIDESIVSLNNDEIEFRNNLTFLSAAVSDRFKRNVLDYDVKLAFFNFGSYVKENNYIPDFMSSKIRHFDLDKCDRPFFWLEKTISSSILSNQSFNARIHVRDFF